MNNYIYANLVTGKIGKTQSGGGKPVFTVGELNETQIYFLDYPNPNYPAGALNDGFAFSAQSADQNQPLTIRTGPAIGQVIASQNIWYSLPTNVTFNITKGDSSFFINTYPVSVSGNISVRGNMSYTLNSIGLPPITRYQKYSFTYFSGMPLSELKTELDNLMNLFNTVPRAASRISQIDDYSIYYTSYSSPRIDDASMSVTTGLNNLRSASGKYSSLDFTSNQWDLLIGNNNETEIWIDVMLGSSIVAQGPAILRKKLST